MQRITDDQTIYSTQSNELWRLTRQRRVLAIIERAWDDQHWFLFLPNAEGDLAFSSVHRRIAGLKIFLRLWARQLPPISRACARIKE